MPWPAQHSGCHSRLALSSHCRGICIRCANDYSIAGRSAEPLLVGFHSDGRLRRRCRRTSPGAALISAHAVAVLLRGRGGSECQQLLRVAVRDALTVGGANRNGLQKRRRLGHRSIRMIGGKHDPVHPDLQQQLQKRWGPIESAERVMDVAAKVLATLNFWCR
jgi:hypothetical protein